MLLRPRRRLASLLDALLLTPFAQLLRSTFVGSSLRFGLALLVGPFGARLCLPSCAPGFLLQTCFLALCAASAQAAAVLQPVTHEGRSRAYSICLHPRPFLLR